MAKKINLTKDNRKAYDRYMEVQAELKALEKEAKELKATLETAFTENRECVVTNGTTEFSLCTIQRLGKPVHVVYERTTARGNIDWQAAYKALGGSESFAEQFRKPSTIRTAIKEVSEKMLAKYNELMNK